LRTSVKSALARWVLHKTQTSGRTALTSRDEATHDWDGRRHFAEDYTFVCVQPHLGVLVRLEWLPGRDTHRVWLMVFRDGEAFTLPHGQLLSRCSNGDRWRVAGLEIDCVEPFRRWELRFAGKLQRAGAAAREPGERGSLELSFSGDAPPFCPGPDDDPQLIAQHISAATWDGNLIRSVRRVMSRTYVQMGEARGMLAVGSELVPIQASGVRQHSWGVRDWGASDEAFQCYAALADGRRFWVQRARFPVVTLEGGFVCHDHRNDPVRSLGVGVERRPNRAPSRANVAIETGSQCAEIDGRIVSDATLVVDGRGEIRLGLFACASGGWGFWGGQRRVLPRRLRR
jgi:hypothetical protein